MIGPEDLVLFERSLSRATTTTGVALDAALTDLGWGDALADDPRIAISLLFRMQGAAHATSSALEWVLRQTLCLEDRVILPALGSWNPPGALHAGRLTVVGLTTVAPDERDRVVVVSRTGDTDIAITVPAAALSFRPVSGIDPEIGLIEVSADAVETFEGEAQVTGWGGAADLARLAVGYELVGASSKMLELARTHALERIQFGRPISTFQAIRHRLAETLVAIEMAEGVLDASWTDGSPQSAEMAKALAGRGARLTARHCQQVLAGIGFTVEHPLHLYVRRTLVLDQLFGSSRAATRQLGLDLLAGGRLPSLFPL